MIPSEKVATRRIDCENVVLLPYTKALVPIYHSWMQNPELLTLTSSEPLTLEQEHANQVSWGLDPTKYCFIIHSRRPVLSFRSGPGVQTPFGIDYTLDSEEQAEEMRKPVHVEDEGEDQEDEEKEEEQAEEVESVAKEKQTKASETGAAGAGDEAAAAASAAVASAAATDGTSAASATAPSTSASVPAPASSLTASAFATPEPGSRYPLTPIGDVNVFLHPDFNLGDYGIAGGGAELEVMLAEPAYRGKGLATEAVKAIMQFSARRLGVQRFVAKVLSTNAPSVALFEKRLGFQMIEYVECFDECVYYKDISAEMGDEDEEEEEEEEEARAAGAAPAVSSEDVDAAAAAGAQPDDVAALSEGVAKLGNS